MSEKCQPITGEGQEVSANHRRGAKSVSQSQEGSEKCQPITGGGQEVSANHRRGEASCQPITGGEQEASATHRKGARSVSQSQATHLHDKLAGICNGNRHNPKPTLSNANWLVHIKKSSSGTKHSTTYLFMAHVSNTNIILETIFRT